VRALPILFQRVDADRTRNGVDVGVVDLGQEVHRWWDRRKIMTGSDPQQKEFASVGRIGGSFQFDLK